MSMDELWAYMLKHPEKLGMTLEGFGKAACAAGSKAAIFMVEHDEKLTSSVSAPDMDALMILVSDLLRTLPLDIMAAAIVHAELEREGLAEKVKIMHAAVDKQWHKMS